MKCFLELRPVTLRRLATELRCSQAWSESLRASVARWVPAGHITPVTGELTRLSNEGMRPDQVAEILETLAQAGSAAKPVSGRLDLVWMGPDVPGAISRDTGAVVRELFNRAESRVLSVGYAVFKGREVYSALTQRMTENRNLQVRLVLSIHRRVGETNSSMHILRRFARDFVENQWPGPRLPEVFFDPRELELNHSDRVVLHAKCVVADGSTAFVSSANFTPPHLGRNIDVGVLIRSVPIATTLEGHIESLISSGALERLDLR